jgi:Ca2+-binding EF-hand superfamily protein
VRDCFQYLDIFNDGLLTNDGLKRILHQNKLYTTDSEITWLFDRFDKNKNGRINYQEFMEEIMPKKSLK